MLGLRRDTHVARYRQIAQVLTHHGLGYLVGITGLERFLPLRGGMFGRARRDHPHTPPQHVRMALEELGPTFIKLGQILSTRSDLLPPKYLEELAKLQDAAPPVPADVIQEILVAELGQSIESVFPAFEPVPLAAASIGQVHAATLQDGTNVVVKIRRPDVVERVAEDLEIIQNLAGVLAPYAERLLLRQYSPILWAKRLGQAGFDAARLGVELPQHLRRIMGELERGGLQVGMRPEGLDPFVRRLERIANRISAGFIAAAFINGLAVLMAFYRPAGWEQLIGALFPIGFFLAGALGVYLAWSILRSGRG